jgi:catechol 2,3-dioxygenase-like lactoylglutathione lyase family enzyme
MDTDASTGTGTHVGREPIRRSPVACSSSPHEKHQERSHPVSRHIQITFDAHDPQALSSFWRDVLGYVHPGPPGIELPEGADPLAAWDDFLARIGVPKEQRNTRSAIEDPAGHGPRVFFQQVPEGKVAKNRVHLDVRAAPGLAGAERMAALEAECDRLVALGAKRVRRDEPAPPMGAGLIVMTDPEGNEFCLD